APRFPQTTDLLPGGAVGNVSVKTFSNSVIAAGTLGKVKLAHIVTANSGTAFGLTADLLGGLAASNEAKERLKLPATSDPAALDSELAAQTFAAGDFVIRLA